MREREKRTEEKRQYLESMPDLTVVSIRECQWYHQKWADKQKDMETFLNQHFPGRSEKEQTQGQLLRRVQEGTFFGALEVDIDTPPPPPRQVQRNDAHFQEHGDRAIAGGRAHAGFRRTAGRAPTRPDAL